MFVDSHCHLERYPDPLGVLASAEAACVTTVVVTEIPSAFQSLNLRLGKRRLVRVALGIHPLRAARLNPLELTLFGRLLSRTDYVGEVGLDRSREGRETFAAQARVFERVLEHPEIGTKVLTVHSRGAEAETIEMLGQAGCTAILHWYSGALKHIDAALEAGLWFSVNPAMLRSQNGRRIVAALPRERIVTETDGPFTKVGGRGSEPRDIPSVVMGLADVWGEEQEEARRRVFDNMAAVFASARPDPNLPGE